MRLIFLLAAFRCDWTGEPWFTSGIPLNNGLLLTLIWWRAQKSSDQCPEQHYVARIAARTKTLDTASILPCPALPSVPALLSLPTLLYSILLCPTLPCPTLPYPTLHYPTLPYTTYPTLPYPTLPYPTLSCPTLPYPTISYPSFHTTRSRKLLTANLGSLSLIYVTASSDDPFYQYALALSMIILFWVLAGGTR